MKELQRKQTESVKYTEQELAAVAKRENNKKRTWLVVNRLQGKHVPVSPGKALRMFDSLADLLLEEYQGERLLLIGFAETATAVGAAVAEKLGALYIQTTREQIRDVEYFYFSEQHSHATEQKLVKDDLDPIIGKVSRVVFLEDEVTTGNTILNIVRLIRSHYGEQIRFSVASILNGMDSAAEAIFQKRQIPLHYLVKIDHAKYPQLAENYRGDGNYMNCSNDESESRVKLEDSEINQFGEINGINKINQINKNNFGANKLNNVYYLKNNTNSICFNSACSDINYINNKCYYIDGFDNRCFIKEFTVEGCRNARRIQDAKVYQNACEQLCQKICAQIEPPDQILVLGTEEFMYPALLLAAKLEEQGKSVRFHATTRSPIAVSTESEYPLHARYELASIYDNQRRTFVYNLAAYNAVIIISDAPITSAEGKNSIYKALAHSGNQNITLVQWKE